MSEIGRIALGLGWSLGDRWRKGSTVLRRLSRMAVPFGRGRFRRFLFAPPDIHTADPTMAADIYAGQFIFAGQLVNASDGSPFDLQPPSHAWAEELHGFGWLRHLHAANSALARDNARGLISEYLDGDYGESGIGAMPLVIASRIKSFLAHSPMVLDGAEHDFYHLYLDGVRTDLTLLRDALRRTDDPFTRLSALVAMTSAGLCIEGAERLGARAGARLSAELGAQIRPDGGHVSRNPRVLVELMLDLLPLKATYAASGVDCPPAILSAMDRIVPHIRLLRHGDGSLAVMNGMGATEVDALATIFASWDVGGGPAMDAPDTGYARLEQGAALFIADAGPAPPFAASGEATAGACSFEFSHGRQRIFVNCGSPRREVPGSVVELRTTAACNATVVGEQSSARFLKRNGVVRLHGGPRTVSLQRLAEPNRVALRMGHDGYVARQGVEVTREIALSEDGAALSGEERLSLVGKAATLPPVLTRFHLHPTVRPERQEDGSVILRTASGDWRFTPDAASLEIEDSAFFAGAEGARRTFQLVLTPSDPSSGLLRWRMTRLG